jgi:hypothetical protein
MTTQYADLSTVTGQTLTAQLFAVTGDTVLYTADSVTERTNAKGVYRCTFGETSSISGTYRLILFSGSTPYASGIRVFRGIDGETAKDDTGPLRQAIVNGAVTTGSTTTVVQVSVFAPALTTTDQVKGRIIIFDTDTTTAALRGQGAPISGSTTTSITVAAGDAFTTSAASGDTFTIY